MQKLQYSSEVKTFGNFVIQMFFHLVQAKMNDIIFILNFELRIVLLFKRVFFILDTILFVTKPISEKSGKFLS